MPSDGSLSAEAFFRDYGTALTNGTAAVFAGAGLSRAAGYVDWAELLKDFADELGLDLKIETDLVSVAQYHVNAEGGTRSRLQQRIVDKFGDLHDLTPSQETLARLPIDLYWTTNYDDLLERALRDADRTPQVKSAASSLTVTQPSTDATVHKLHGDLSDPGNIVITRDDYEEYIDKHQGYRERLQSDLIARTFLFVGFSFTDPHLSFILSELRRMHRASPRTHYVVMRREALGDHDDEPGYRYAKNRQHIRIGDLKRYGIQTILVDSYDEIPQLLQSLRSRYLRRHVFVSGAAHDYAPLGQDWINRFGALLGSRLISDGYNVVSGFGSGVGSLLVFGALEQLYASSDPRIDRRLLLRPFPQAAAGVDTTALYTKYREDMMAIVGFAIFLAGNREAGGRTEVSPGVIEEFDIGRAAGAYPLPIGASGWAAAEIWNTVNSGFDAFFPSVKPPADAWATLNDPSAEPAKVVAALIEIMSALRPS